MLLVAADLAAAPLGYSERPVLAMSELGKLEIAAGTLAALPCLVFHHCIDIWASISSIFFSVIARSSGLDGIEL